VVLLMLWMLIAGVPCDNCLSYCMTTEKKIVIGGIRSMRRTYDFIFVKLVIETP